MLDALELKAIGGIALAAALFAGCEYQMHKAEVRGAQQCQAASAAANAKAEADYRALEQRMQATKDQAAHDYAIAQKRSAVSLAAARAGASKLRDDIARYSNVAPTDSAASAGERTSAIGSVLDGVLSDLATCSAGAESAADSYRALRVAWPSNETIALPKLKLGTP